MEIKLDNRAAVSSYISFLCSNSTRLERYSPLNDIIQYVIRHDDDGGGGGEVVCNFHSKF